MFTKFKEEVATVLTQALKETGYETESDLLDLSLEESQHADIATSISFKLAKIHKQNPKEIANKIFNAIVISEDTLISEKKVVGPYINFFVNREFLNKTLYNILSPQKKVIKEKVIIEHTSANPNGPLHVGHIRNSVIGDTLARIFKKAGYDVETQYYVNDMGRQIAIVVWGLDNFEFDKSKKSDHAIADVYIKANRVIQEIARPSEKSENRQALVHKKSEIDTLMQKYEKGDKETVEKFENAVNLAISGIKTTLEKMNIHHDRYIWESEFVRSGFIKEVVENIKSNGKIQIENNALIVLLEGFEKGLVIQRGDGTSLYSTRDIAYHVWKANQCHKMINILGADHKLISSQLKAVLKIINCTQPEIVIFEFVGLPSGSMSTRRGKFISADELLEEVEKQAFLEVDRRRSDMDLNFKKKVANSVGIGAVRYDIVKVSADKATTFDWKSALDFEKRGAPFIQYAHARACNILKKANQNIESLEFDPNLLILSQEIDLIKKLSKFSYVINRSAQELKPHLFATYARELAELFNQFYRYVPVISAEDIRRIKARLALVNCSRIVLADTLATLGIDAPEEI